MEQTTEGLFREGDLSPSVYSFAQMRGVTSTTLVDFSCRFTWSLTSLNDKKKEEDIKHIPSQYSLQSRPTQTHQAYNQTYPGYPSSPLLGPISNPLLCPVSSPHTSQLPAPPPQHFPRYNYGYNMYPGPHMTPKKFSPVLIYQRPTFTSGNDTARGCYDNVYGEGHGFPVPSYDCVKLDGLKTPVNNTCNVNVHSDHGHSCWASNAPLLTHQPSLWGHRDIASRNSVQLSHRVGTPNSAFQAWRPYVSSGNNPFQDLPNPPEFKPNFQQNPYTDSAKLKFFLDTKYGLADSPDFPVSPEADLTFKPDLSSEFSLDAAFTDPFLELLHEPLAPLQSADDTDDSKRGRKYKCPFCHVSCTNNGQLKGHLRVHTGEKPYRCEFGDCGRAFARNEELTRHRRIHSGIRPHTCITCGKKFGRKDHLNKHQKTHLKTAEKKVHMCNVPGCEQRYTRSDALARHQWGAHGIKSKSPKWRTQMRENL